MPSAEVAYCRQVGRKKKLPEIDRASADIASNQVCIPGLQLCRGPGTPRQNTIAKSRREALDLLFQSVHHVNRRAMGNMAIGPCNVFAHRSTRRIEQRRLRQQNERSLRGLPACHGCFGRRNLCHAAAQVHGRGTQAFRSLPWNRRRQRIIQLEDPRTIAKIFQPSLIPFAENFLCDKCRSWRGVMSHIVMS